MSHIFFKKDDIKRGNTIIFFSSGNSFLSYSKPNWIQLTRGVKTECVCKNKKNRNLTAGCNDKVNINTNPFFHRSPICFFCQMPCFGMEIMVTLISALCSKHTSVKKQNLDFQYASGKSADYKKGSFPYFFVCSILSGDFGF